MRIILIYIYILFFKKEQKRGLLKSHTFDKHGLYSSAQTEVAIAEEQQLYFRLPPACRMRRRRPLLLQ